LDVTIPELKGVSLRFLKEQHVLPECEYSSIVVALKKGQPFYTDIYGKLEKLKQYSLEKISTEQAGVLLRYLGSSSTIDEADNVLILEGKVVLSDKRLVFQLLLARLEHYTNSTSKSPHDYRTFRAYANCVFIFKCTETVLNTTGI
jgi:hypothetical protein